MNVALYSPTHGRWAFTEYPLSAVQCARETFSLGHNQLSWNGRELDIQIDERAAPVPRPIQGSIRLTPEVATEFALTLDRSGCHHWYPIFPRGSIEVRLNKPDLHWSGTGYLDSNTGSAPLDEAMLAWNWLRAHTSSGTKVIYDLIPTRGRGVVHALHINSHGEVQHLNPPPRASLPTTAWGIGRETHADFGFVPRVIRSLEDTPFYSRDLIETMIGGEQVTAVHESLSLERFRSSWVRTLLPFRMRRSRR